MDPVTPGSDEYLVLLDGPEGELKVRGSRFVGQAFHAPDLEQVHSRVTAVRKRHHAATHHCWAARFGGMDRLTERSEDDGEPSGTAGVPILKPLAGRLLHNGLVVVTRYYGGVKLGTGGLARAYSDAAVLALKLAPVETVLLEDTVALTCSWEDMGTVEAILARAGSDILGVERGFEGEPHLEVTVRRSVAGALRRALVESTGGRVRLTGL
jgi:uncharacterized YigZ family protein